jgi:hypothetical protein
MKLRMPVSCRLLKTEVRDALRRENNHGTGNTQLAT